MTSTSPAPLPFGGAAFVKDSDAALYLGLGVRSIRYLVTEGKLRRVYPKPRAARLTSESVTAYREAIEQGKPPRTWIQPGNPHTTSSRQPEPKLEPQKKPGLLSRWGLGS